MTDYEQRCKDALMLAFEYAQIDGDHHKAWVIDQMVRTLTGPDYKEWVRIYEGKPEGMEDVDTGELIERGYDFWEWNTGVAP